MLELKKRATTDWATTSFFLDRFQGSNLGHQAYKNTAFTCYHNSQASFPVPSGYSDGLSAVGTLEECAIQYSDAMMVKTEVVYLTLVAWPSGRHLRSRLFWLTLLKIGIATPQVNGPASPLVAAQSGILSLPTASSFHSSSLRVLRGEGPACLTY